MSVFEIYLSLILYILYTCLSTIFCSTCDNIDKMLDRERSTHEKLKI